MAQDSPRSGEPKLETITSDKLAIERGSLIAGKISFQIRNIASLVVSTIPRSGCAVVIVGVIAGAVIGVVLALAFQNLGGFFLGFLIGMAATLYGMRDDLVDTYELQLLTNAATSFRIVHKDEKFLLRLKNAIEEVMQRGDNSVIYHVNIAEQKIDRIEANTTNVSHSPGAAVVGGSATNVSQSTKVTIQGLQDVDALLKIVQNSSSENREFFRYHLKIVQQYLSGARSREEAKSSWVKFVEHVELIANSGNNVWELVARVGSIFA
ncbi:MAG: hypothetical protein QOF14_4130 [Hyphomicrobiales bacterium]|jgi:hypothetical protein|nr:hypothetical protein [Hyphomicrobiales bacterium]